MRFTLDERCLKTLYYFLFFILTIVNYGATRIKRLSNAYTYYKNGWLEQLHIASISPILPELFNRLGILKMYWKLKIKG